MRWFKITGTPPNFPPHYNAAPGQDLPVVRLHPESGDRVLGALRWGLIPYWSKDPKNRSSPPPAPVGLLWVVAVRCCADTIERSFAMSKGKQARTTKTRSVSRHPRKMNNPDCEPRFAVQFLPSRSQQGAIGGVLAQARA
jgi:hypothetical protein